MKTFTKILTCMLLLLTNLVSAQNQLGKNSFKAREKGEYLNVNNVRARIESAGDLFSKFDTTQYYVGGPGLTDTTYKYSAQFEVPKGSGDHTMFGATLWIGGQDINNDLHIAGQRYRQDGNDFWPGPVMNSSAYSPAQDAAWNRVWKLNKSMVDSFKNNMYSVVPIEIATWPGNGDVSLGQSNILAPFHDANQDGIYSPANGDYPLIKGDQAVLFIFNDDRDLHTETNGQKLKIEVCAMAYAFANTSLSAVHNTVFIDYTITNKSLVDYDSTYFGMWSDFDLGNYNDDYVGCDVPRNTFYAYNGMPNDGANNGPGNYGGPAFGNPPPPAQGITILEGPPADSNDGNDNNNNGMTDEPGEDIRLSGHMYFSNNGGPYGDPIANPYEHYNFLKSTFKNGQHISYGGLGNATGMGNTNQPCDYFFPGTSDPAFTAPWTESLAGNLPSDRRSVGSTGPFTFETQETIHVTYAYVFSRTVSGTNAQASVDQLKQDVDVVENFYKMGFNAPLAVTGNNDKNESLTIYPNPAQTVLHIENSELHTHINIYNTSGQLLMHEELKAAKSTVQIAELPIGLYLLQLQDDRGEFHCKRFVKE
jgi:hypothetical protein